MEAAKEAPAYKGPVIQPRVLRGPFDFLKFFLSYEIYSQERVQSYNDKHRRNHRQTTEGISCTLLISHNKLPHA